MKTQANKDLKFTKASVVELNEEKLAQINGGDGTVATEPTVKHWTTPFCSSADCNNDAIVGAN